MNHTLKHPVLMNNHKNTKPSWLAAALLACREDWGLLRVEGYCFAWNSCAALPVCAMRMRVCCRCELGWKYSFNGPGTKTSSSKKKMLFGGQAEAC